MKRGVFYKPKAFERVKLKIGLSYASLTTSRDLIKLILKQDGVIFVEEIDVKDV